MFIGIAIDTLMLIAAVFIVYRSAKQGFALMLFNILAFICAFILAAVAAKYLSSVIYDGMFKDSVTQKIQDSVSNVSSSAATSAKDVVSNNFPMISSFSSISDFSIDTSLISSYGSNVADSISQNIVAPMYINIISMVVYILTLIISLPILRFFAKKLAGIFKVSIIGKINTVLGAIFGIPKAIIILIFASVIIILLSSVFLKGDSPVLQGVGNSFVLDFVSSAIIKL